MGKIMGFTAVLFALIVLSGCGSSATNQNSAPGAPANTSVPITDSENSISIQNFAFNPGTLTIKKGTVVAWTNNDSSAHTIKSSSFSSGNLAKGDTFKFTFNNSGTFDYSCGVHPSMTGKIIVE